MIVLNNLLIFKIYTTLLISRSRQSTSVLLEPIGSVMPRDVETLPFNPTFNMHEHIACKWVARLLPA